MKTIGTRTRFDLGLGFFCLLASFISEIGEAVVGFDIENTTVLKCGRFVRSRRIGWLRITRGCWRVVGRRVGRRCRDDGHAGGRCGDSGRVGLPANVFRVRQFVVLFPFHASILKPDFYLTLGQAEAVGDFDATAPRQVAIEMKFFLQFKNLMASVGCALSLWFHSRRESSIG